jgi:WD40 repeat protein
MPRASDFNSSSRYNSKLAAVVQRRFPHESSGERSVRKQPICLAEGKSIWESNGDINLINVRRSHEAAFHLMRAGLPCEAVAELCDFEGLCARIRCGDGYFVVAQLAELSAQLRALHNAIDSETTSAAITRVDHFRRWLTRDLALIIEAPERELFASCSEQPFSSVVRQSVMPVFLSERLASPSINQSSLVLSVVIGRSLPDFDECEAVLRGHTACVRCIAWAPSSSKCASASDDGSIRIWTAGTGAVEMLLTGHQGAVRCVAWNERETLASGGKDQTVRIWSTSTSTLQETLIGHAAEINCLSWSKSSAAAVELLASGSADKTIRIWDVKNQPCSCFRMLHVNADVLTVAFSSDGLNLAAGSDEDMSIRIYCARSWKCSVIIREVDAVNCICFSPAGDCLASCTGNFSVYGAANIWSVRSGKKLQSLRGNAHGVYSISWSSDGSVLATASWDKSVRLWSCRTGALLKHFSGHSHCVSCVAFSNHGSRLASASYDRTIRIYNVQQYTHPLHSNPQGISAALSDDTSIIGCNQDAVTDVCWFPDGARIASSSQDASVRIWSSRSGREAVHIAGGTHYASKNTDEVLGVSCSADGSFIATACADGSIRFFDSTNGRQLHVFSAHSARVNRIRISPDGFLMASCSKDRLVKIWGVGSRLLLREVPGHEEAVRCVAWSPDSSLLASGSDDQCVHVWQAQSGELLQVLRGHSGGVFALDWACKGGLLASRCIALQRCPVLFFMHSHARAAPPTAL